MPFIHLLFLLNDKVKNVERICDAMFPEDERFHAVGVDAVQVIAKQRKEDDFIFEINHASTCTYLTISETNFRVTNRPNTRHFIFEFPQSEVFLLNIAK